MLVPIQNEYKRWANSALLEHGCGLRVKTSALLAIALIVTCPQPGHRNHVPSSFTHMISEQCGQVIAQFGGSGTLLSVMPPEKERCDVDHSIHN